MVDSCLYDDVLEPYLIVDLFGNVEGERFKSIAPCLVNSEVAIVVATKTELCQVGHEQHMTWNKEVKR